MCYWIIVIHEFAGRLVFLAFIGLGAVLWNSDVMWSIIIQTTAGNKACAEPEK